MAARPRLKMRAGSGIWQDAMRAARFNFPRSLRAATKQQRKSGRGSSTLAGENAGRGERSIQRETAHRVAAKNSAPKVASRYARATF